MCVYSKCITSVSLFVSIVSGFSDNIYSMCFVGNNIFIILLFYFFATFEQTVEVKTNSNEKMFNFSSPQNKGVKYDKSFFVILICHKI